MQSHVVLIYMLNKLMILKSLPSLVTTASLSPSLLQATLPPSTWQTAATSPVHGRGHPPHLHLLATTGQQEAVRGEADVLFKPFQCNKAVFACLQRMKAGLAGCIPEPDPPSYIPGGEDVLVPRAQTTSLTRAWCPGSRTRGVWESGAQTITRWSSPPEAKRWLVGFQQMLHNTPVCPFISTAALVLSPIVHCDMVPL